VSGLAVLVGAELNAEIEHASPYGKEPGEKVAGEKRKIGPAAERAWRESQAAGTSKPALAAANCIVDDVPLPAPPPPPRRTRFGDWALTGLVVAETAWLTFAKLRRRPTRPGP
jgi:membrane protein